MTMLEKVARAICLANTQGDEMWQAFVPEARAALEAMREPTEGMVRAGRDAAACRPRCDGDFGNHRGVCRRVRRACRILTLIEWRDAIKAYDGAFGDDDDAGKQITQELRINRAEAALLALIGGQP